MTRRFVTALDHHREDGVWQLSVVLAREPGDAVSKLSQGCVRR